MKFVIILGFLIGTVNCLSQSHCLNSLSLLNSHISVSSTHQTELSDIEKNLLFLSQKTHLNYAFLSIELESGETLSNHHSLIRFNTLIYDENFELDLPLYNIKKAITDLLDRVENFRVKTVHVFISKEFGEYGSSQSQKLVREISSSNQFVNDAVKINLAFVDREDEDHIRKAVFSYF